MHLLVESVARNQAFQPPRTVLGPCVPLKEVLRLLNDGMRVWTRCVAATGEAEEHLICRERDFICLERALDDGFFMASRAHEQHVKRISLDAFCSYLVLEDFRPRGPKKGLLPLQEGDVVVVTSREKGKWTLRWHEKPFDNLK